MSGEGNHFSADLKYMVSAAQGDRKLNEAPEMGTRNRDLGPHLVCTVPFLASGEMCPTLIPGAREGPMEGFDNNGDWIPRHRRRWGWGGWPKLQPVSSHILVLPPSLGILGSWEAHVS